MTNTEDDQTWLFGLERLFDYLGKTNNMLMVKYIISMIHSPIKDKPWTLARCITHDYENFTEEFRRQRISSYSNIMSKQSVTQATLFWLLQTVDQDDFIQKLFMFFNNTDYSVANDLFSKSQVTSKIWMAEALEKNTNNLGNVVIMGGWYGQHKWYLDKFKYKKIYNIDLDSTVLEHSTNIMGSPDTYEVAVADATTLVNDDGQIVVNGNVIDAGLVINTSAEHMSTEWFDRLPLGQAVLLQSNNMVGMAGHINCVTSLEELKTKFPMRHQFFAGELTLHKGIRYMRYGIK